MEQKELENLNWQTNKQKHTNDRTAVLYKAKRVNNLGVSPCQSQNAIFRQTCVCGG